MKKILLTVLLFISCLFLNSCSSSLRQETRTAVGDYNTAAQSANQAVKDYNDAVDEFLEQNDQLEAAIQEAKDAADSGGIPFDDETLVLLNEEIQAAAESELSVPEKLTLAYEELEEPGWRMRSSALDEEKEKAQDLLDDLRANPVTKALEVPDYSREITALSDAASAYEDSVAGYALVLDPSEDYVRERLSLIDSITDIEAEPFFETENSDTDDQACIYFTDSRVDLFALYVRDEEPGAAELGVKGGGSVQIYDSEEQAQKKDEELSAYDGTIFGGGAHRCVGAMLIRVSDLLTTEEQLQLLNGITNALLLPAI